MTQYISINGQFFKNEQEARDYYGTRFEGALKNSLLFVCEGE